MFEHERLEQLVHLAATHALVMTPDHVHFLQYQLMFHAHGLGLPAVLVMGLSRNTNQPTDAHQADARIAVLHVADPAVRRVVLFSDADLLLPFGQLDQARVRFRAQFLILQLTLQLLDRGWRASELSFLGFINVYFASSFSGLGSLRISTYPSAGIHAWNAPLQVIPYLISNRCFGVPVSKYSSITLRLNASLYRDSNLPFFLCLNLPFMNHAFA